MGTRLIKSSDEYQRFLDLYDRFPRSVTSAVGSGAGASERPLTGLLGRELGRLQRQTAQAWTGLVITVDEGDGMTWSAAAADRLVDERAPTLRRYHLTRDRRPDGFPQITEVVPRRRLIAIAQQTEAAPRLPALRPRWILLAALALLVLGAATGVVNSLTKGSSGPFSPVFLLLGAVGAVLVLAGQEVAARLKQSERAAAERALVDALKDAPTERPDAWSKFLEALRNEMLVVSHDRCVIVDDFDRLDEITKGVLSLYLSDRERLAEARELWVIFEDSELGSLSNDLTLDPPARSRLRVRLELAHQTNLDKADRARLADEVGRPQRADFQRVKWITQRDARPSDAYAKLFQGELSAREQDGYAYGPLELLFILAVDHRTGAIDFSQSDLITDLTGQERSARGQVLRLILPKASLERAAVTNAFERLRNNLSRALDADQPGTHIEVVREAADEVIARRADYGLPQIGMVHLFWALYWHSKLVGAQDVEPYKLRKLARHLVEAVPPEASTVEFGGTVKTRYAEALTWTARELLSASLPDQLPTILSRAEAAARRENDRRLLRSVCWQAYAVLGDETVLGVLLRLHGGQAGKRTTFTDVDEIFVESLTFQDRSPKWRHELLARMSSLDAGIVDYGRARGLLLALTLQRAAGSWSMFSRASNEGAAISASLVRRSLGRLSDPSKPRVAIDALTASLATWCFALASRFGALDPAEANDLFEDVRLRALNLHDDLNKLRPQGATGDFVLRSFVQELELMAGVGAALVEDHFAMQRAPTVERDRVRDHIKAAMPGPRAAKTTVAEALGARMGLQALTWVRLGYGEGHPLGFEQLAGFMTLRRAHFEAMMSGEGRSVAAVNRAMSYLASELSQPGTAGLLAHAVVMEASPSEEIQALLWARAAERSLDAGLGARLEKELCLVAVSVAHAFHRVTVARILDYLVARVPTNGNAWLADRLAGFDGEARSDASRWLLNAAGKPDVAPATKQALIDEVRGLAARDDQDEDVRADIEELLDVFELTELDEAVVPDAAGTLKRWQSRRDRSNNYAFMVHLLVKRMRSNDEVLESATSYLRDHPERPSVNGPIFLAMDLAEHPASDVDDAASAARKKLALDFLRRVHPTWERTLGIDTNLAVLRLLLRNDVGDRADVFARFTRWETARQERDGLEKLPQLVEAGRFFLVLWHYYETLAPFGLKAEPATSAYELASPDRTARALSDFLAHGRVIPDVFISVGGKRTLSAEFLAIGCALFLNPHDGAANLEDDADGCNEAARRALPAVYEALISLPSIPAPLQRLLAEHRDRLLRPTVRV